MGVLDAVTLLSEKKYMACQRGPYLALTLSSLNPAMFG